MKFRIIILATLLFFGLTAFSLAGDAPPQTDATATPTVQSEATAEPVEAEPTAAVVTGAVQGKVLSGSGVTLDEGMMINLHGFDLDANSNASEVVFLSAAVARDGSYIFEGVEIPTGRIFLVETTYQGVAFQSDYVIAAEPPVSLPDMVFYEVSEDLGYLTVDEIHVALNYDTEGVVQVVEMYIMSNTSDHAVSFATDGSSIPFISLPEGASDATYQVASGSATFSGTADGVALIPLADGSQYGLVAVFSLPYEKRMTLDLPFILPATSLTFFVPTGVKLRSDQLTEKGTEEYSGFVYDLYELTDMPADSVLTVKLSGYPEDDSAADPEATSKTQQLLIIGLGTAGMLLIGVGLFLFARDRNRRIDEEEDLEDELAERVDARTLPVPAAPAEGEAPEENLEARNAILDAIIALDDQFKAGEIDRKAYDKRRAEMKEELRKLA